MVFHVNLVSPDIMLLIIEFAYTGSVAMTEDNVCKLMIAADMLNVMGIIQPCSNFIFEHICPQNCIGIWQFTDICPCPELRCKAFHYIMEHFEGAVIFEEYLSLSVVQLIEILGKDELNVKNESTVFDVILHWIAHIPKEREHHIALLLSKVRLGKTSIEYIENNVVTNRLVKLNPECQEIVNLTFKIMRSFKKRKTFKSSLCDTPARPRLPNSLILLCGGKTESHISCSIEVYDHLVDRWVYIKDKLKAPLAKHGTVFLNGYVYFVGGSRIVHSLNSMASLDLRTHTWQDLVYMHYHRSQLCVTVLDGYIYALGGCDGTVCLNTAERYCPKTNQWTVISPMIEGRKGASCTTLNGKIYVCGGFTGHYSTRTAECYDPETDQWTAIHNMSVSRALHRVVAYNNQIYAIGGMRVLRSLKSIETYMPTTNTWITLCPMSITRRNFCLEVIEDKFYVVGGTNFRTKNYHAEVYDPHTDEWSPISDSSMSYGGMSSCVVSGIPNMVDFAFPRDSLPLFKSQEMSD